MRKAKRKRHAVRDVMVPDGRRSYIRTGRRVISVILLTVILTLFLLPKTPALASGLVEIIKDTSHLYSRYDLDSYQLDFYVDTSWSWLPWGFMDGMERSILYGVYHVTDSLWGVSRIISSFTGEVIGEAYDLDLVGELSEGLGESMQNLAGIGPDGISDGFLKGFLPWILLAAGVYVAYTGLIRRETSRAAGAVVNVLVLSMVTAGLIAYAPDFIENINDFSSDVSKAALRAGTGFLMPGQTEPEEAGDSVDLIRDNLFSVQVYQPWLILQYGTSDEDVIGAERIGNLLSKNPDLEYGSAREAVVIEEIETFSNLNLTATNVGKRFGMVLVLILVNLIISIVVILLCGAMLLSQVMFLLLAMALPVSLVLSMFPTMGGLARTSVLKVFNVVMFRAGITLLVTIAFCVSGMVYGISDGHSFLMTAYLQIVVFVGIYLKKNEILTMFALHDSGEADMQRSVLRNFLVTAFVRDRMSEMRMNRRMEKREKKKDREKKRQEAHERRGEERAQRHETERSDPRCRNDPPADSGPDTGPGIISVIPADGSDPGFRQTEGRSSRTVRAETGVKGSRTDRATETADRTPDDIRKRQEHRETGSPENRIRKAALSPVEIRRNGTETPDGRQENRNPMRRTGRHPAGKNMRTAAAERTRELLERRERQAAAPDRITYHGEQYHGIWADVLSGKEDTPAAPPDGQTADPVRRPGDLMNTVRSFRSFLESARHPGMSGRQKEERTGDRHPVEIREKTDGTGIRQEEMYPDRRQSSGGIPAPDRRQEKAGKASDRETGRTAGNRMPDRDRRQEENLSRTQSDPDDRTVGMTAGTVARDPGDRDRRQEETGNLPDRDRRQDGNLSRPQPDPGGRTAGMTTGTVVRSAQTAEHEESAETPVLPGMKGFHGRSGTGKRGDTE